MEKHHEHDLPPHLQLQHPIVQLKSGCSSSLALAHLKPDVFRVAWTHCLPIHLLPCIFPPFLYLGSVENHPGSEHQLQLRSQHHVFVLRFERSSGPAHLKLNGFMLPWTPCWSIHLLPCIFPPFLYLGSVENHPGSEHQLQLVRNTMFSC